MTPEGWARAPLGEVLVHLGRGTSPKYAADPSAIRAVNQKCVRNGRVGIEHVRAHEPTAPVKDDSVLRTGDVCVNSTGTGTIGRVGLWEAPAEGTYFADTHVTVVRPNPVRVVSKFLSETLLAPWMQREMEVSCFTGSTNQIELSRSAFAELTLLLPPLGEQRKIAAILSAVDEAIEATKAVIDQLQVVKKAMMAELLTRGLPGRHTRFKMTEIGEVPEEWGLVRLDEVGTLQTGIAKGKQVDGGVDLPYLRVANVQDGHVDLTEIKTITVEARSVDRYSLRSGDVLFTEGGDADKLGRGCVWEAQVDPCLHQNHVFAVRPNLHRLLSQFLAYWGASPRGKAYFLECAKQTTNLASINSTQLKALPVPLPSLEEQRAIVRAIGTVEDRSSGERAKLGGLSNTKSALMPVLLTGEIRVKPDDEAA